MDQHNVGETYEDSSADSSTDSGSPEAITFGSDVDEDELAETLVALANGRGGALLLQLEESNLEDSIAEALDRLRAASLRAEPILILPQPAMMDTATLVVNVPQGLSHVFALNGRFLTRDGLVNRSLAPRELRRLLIERADLNYEEELAVDATLEDLNWRAVEAYAARIGGSDALAVLSQRGCIGRRSGESAWTPTNAGLLLFGKDPQRYMRGAFITAVRFAGVQMGDTFTRQDIGGTLPEQIFQAETFLLDNLRRGVQLGGGMERTEQLEYPMEAARELVVNAVSHRDYSIQGDGIRLFLFADRLEVTSPGCLPGPVTLDNIVDERFSRNSIIVQVLSDMGFIERLGYGVDRVIALMRDRGLPRPQFSETSGGFRVKLFNTPEQAGRTPSVGAYAGFELNPRQESALHHLMHGGYQRITNKDLQELFDDVHPETIRRDLADLVNKGLLIKRGQKRGSYYVLSESAFSS